MRDLYAHIGHILKDRFAGWRVGLLCPPELRAHLGLPLRTVLRARNGGLAVELAVGEIAGRSRAVAAG